MAEDLDALLVEAEQEAFGTTWTLTRPGGAPAFVQGVFDRRHVEIQFSDGAPPQSAMRATLLVRLAEMPPGYAPAQGDLAQRATDVWQVADVQPDAMGGALLVLSARGGAPYP
jgi:hypothetical protein